MKRVSVVPILAILAIACQPRDQESTPRAGFSEADRAAIMALNDSAMRYIIRGDWSAWAGNVTEDAVFQPANGRTIRGRQAIEAWARSLPKFDTIHTYGIEIHGSGDLAYMTSGFLAKQGSEMGDSSKQLVVFRKVDGRWLVTAVSVSADTLRMPAPAATRGRR